MHAGAPSQHRQDELARHVQVGADGAALGHQAGSRLGRRWHILEQHGMCLHAAGWPPRQDQDRLDGSGVSGGNAADGVAPVGKAVSQAQPEEDRLACCAGARTAEPAAAHADKCASWRMHLSRCHLDAQRAADNWRPVERNFQ
eukprot:scaffold2993_cov114-Isochrysis_galbana.AAC.4